MAKLKMAFGDIPSDTIEEGTYDATLEKIEFKEAKTGTQYLNWTFALSAPEHLGRKVWMRTFLSPKALWFTRDQFAALGFEVSEDLDIEIDDATDEVIEPVVAGIPVAIDIVMGEPYNNRTTNDVDGISFCYSNEDLGVEDGEEDNPDLL